MTRRFKPIDARGRKIRTGAMVRVVGLPDLGSMHPQARRESGPVFRHLRGTCKRVRGFDQYGFVELQFRILRGRHSGWHSVAIEPHLLRVQNHGRVV
jgi:hypothetical protein